MSPRAKVFEALFGKKKVDESAEREGLAIRHFRTEFVVRRPKCRSQMRKAGR